MATAVVDRRPERGLSWILQQSRTDALVIGGLGLLSMVLLHLGVFVVLTAYDWTPIPNLVEGLKSPELRLVLIVTIVLGAAATVGGAIRFRQMPTNVSREEAASGAILGVQGVMLA